MTAAISAYGVALQLGDGEVTEAFTTIAEVTDLPSPAPTLGTTDVTPHDGTGWREFIPTLLEMAEFTITVNYVPTETTHLNTDGGLLYELTQKRLSNYKIVFPDTGNTEWEFAAYVTAFTPNGPVDGGLEAQVTFRPSGSPTLA